MRFERDELSRELADATRKFVATAVDVSALEALQEDRPAADVLWDQVVEMGLTEVAVAEERGGIGGGVVAAGAVAEESGRGLLPGPVLDTVIARALFGDDLVPAGTGRVSLAVAGPGSGGLPTPEGVRLTGGVLEGSKTSVPDGDRAESLLVLAEHEGGAAFAAVAPSAADVEVHAGYDVLHRPTVVRFDRAAVGDVVVGPDAEQRLEDLTAWGMTLAASRALGVAEAAFDDAVEYARVRHQFGRPIGSFQAVRHRLAGSAVAITSARSACYLAQALIDVDDPARLHAARVAKARTAKVVRSVVEDALQVLGGIGFTVDHRSHRFVKHALTLQGAWGEQHRLEELLGRALLERARA